MNVGHSMYYVDVYAKYKLTLWGFYLFLFFYGDEKKKKGKKMQSKLKFFEISEILNDVKKRKRKKIQVNFTLIMLTRYGFIKVFLSLHKSCMVARLVRT